MATGGGGEGPRIVLVAPSQPLLLETRKYGGKIHKSAPRGGEGTEQGENKVQEPVEEAAGSARGDTLSGGQGRLPVEGRAPRPEAGRGPLHPRLQKSKGNEVTWAAAGPAEQGCHSKGASGTSSPPPPLPWSPASSVPMA